MHDHDHRFRLWERRATRFLQATQSPGAAIAIALVIVLVPAGPRRRNLEMLAAAFAVIMGLRRVYLRAHWLSVVVAGVSLGAAGAIGTGVAMHYLVERGRRRDGADESDRTR